MKVKPITRAGRRTPIYAIVGFVALVGSAAFAWFGHRSPKPSDIEPPERVVIANIVYTGSCPVVVAQAKGYFKSEGIEATVPLYLSGKAALDALLSGKADLAISGDLPVVLAVMNDQPLSVVATVARAENDIGVVGRVDKGITTPASLKGKRIGVTLGTGSHFVLDVFLARHHLALGDVTLRDLTPAALSGALARGEIDAASAWEPILGALRSQLGADGMTFLAGDIYSTTLNLTGMRAYVAGHQMVLQKVVRALISGARLCRNQPDEARALVRAAFNVGTAELNATWPDYRFRVTLDQSLLLGLEDDTRWAIRDALTRRMDMPNYLDYVDLHALEAVAPAAVTLIH
ncbi:nitrate ABC transporter substrate-binding protein [Trinickia symbiotica]|uniref:Nitrate ABC transporter substrate-binding protein n=1 Tax=Trinickia symbiotica TaxID=863227 RepID=A0A2T3XVU5_9BURK|nr:NrtA/SsuA/CpmA family ABC transporter substrate-binding protein [Trinickia symbiotica]PTB20592.1 nitrate ABC transporter substrate-binding protein [Trinickia symbiotica]